MPTRYGVSPWIEDFPGSRRPDHPRLQGEAAADVVIVGAGLTGCATALALAATGARPLVLEAGRVGQGSAGRSAGLLWPDPGPSFRDIQQLHGLRAARAAFESWRRASLDAAALLRRMRIRCGLEARDAAVAAIPERERWLRREYEARTAAGLDGSWLASRQVRENLGLEQGVGIRMHGAFMLDPYRACVGLAAAASKRGARFHEHSHATRIRPATKHVEVVTAAGVVRASTVIVATGSASAEFKPLRRHFRSREIFHALTEPVPPAVRKQLLDTGTTLRGPQSERLQVQWAPEHRLLVSGADLDETPDRKRKDVLVQRTGQLMYETLRMYPAISGLRPTHGWEMGYGATADGLMFIGPHRNFPRHLFALGGDGASVTGAFLAARILTRAVQGAPAKSDEAFGWTR